MSWKPDIFDYLDFREYLGAYFEAARENIDAFSHRYFARRAGFSSSNYVHLAIKGERNLSTNSVRKVIVGLGLDKEEAEFFTDLVTFNQAKDPQTKDEAFEKVAASRRFRSARQIDHSLYEYLSHWYIPAIREMAARDDFRDDPAWVTKQLWPPITEAKARDALRVLFELGLLQKDDDGRIQRVSPSLTTGHEVRNVAVRNYHRQMIERAGEAIDTKPARYREVAAMTTCIEAASIEDLRQRIRTFRESLIQRCEADENPDVVYQINFQMFPLSQPPDDEP
jgi:uncharacterized protein (TIGR02147 family)